VVAVIGAAVVVAAIAAAVGVGLTASAPKAAAGAPGKGTVIVASDLSKAADAAASDSGSPAAREAAAYLAEQPTAYWLLPENDPAESVGATIAHLAQEARAQSARLAVVVYGLPGRDCGSHSAGGLAPDAYADWTAAIGKALGEVQDVEPLVILEPDSLAAAPGCGNVDERVADLRAAVAALEAEHTWIYLDGGHSNWLPVDEMASLLSRVGDAGAVRGFATNVSNYNDTDAENAYAHALAKRLDGMHAIIDTSRNGAGGDGEWCNPAGARVGPAGGTLGDDVVDTNLWIKPPGESDGECNGGPPAGVWWPERAIELTRGVNP
jgi:endoglucanase